MKKKKSLLLLLSVFWVFQSYGYPDGSKKNSKTHTGDIEVEELFYKGGEHYKI